MYYPEEKKLTTWYVESNSDIACDTEYGAIFSNNNKRECSQTKILKKQEQKKNQHAKQAATTQGC